MSRHPIIDAKLQLDAYADWLTSVCGFTTGKDNGGSVKDYISRLVHCVLDYNVVKPLLNLPFEDLLPALLVVGNNSYYVNRLCDYMGRIVSNNPKNSKSLKSYLIAIDKYQDWLLSTSPALGVNITLSPNNLKLIADKLQDPVYTYAQFKAILMNRMNTQKTRSTLPIEKIRKELGRGQLTDVFKEMIPNTLVLTECGIHKLKDLECLKIAQSAAGHCVLWVKPKVYSSPSYNIANAQSKGVKIDTNGYVKAYTYTSNGDIKPFEWAAKQGVLSRSQISIEHSPAISLVIKAGNYPELQKLSNGQQVNQSALLKEVKEVHSKITFMLMDRDENQTKNDNW